MVVEIIGVPMDLGANRRGTDMGPSAVRYAGLENALLKMGLEIIDNGNIDVPVRESINLVDENFIFMDEIVVVCKKLAKMVHEVLERGNFPLVLGGDHSMAIGTIAGINKSIPDLGLIWFDAHGDYNTFDSTGSGNIHGMPLAAATGLGHQNLISLGDTIPSVRADKTVLIGVRDLDHNEKALLRKSKISVYTMKKIDELGMAAVIKDALLIAGHGTSGINVSFDLDVVDPAIANGVGTPVPGGLTYREAHLALELIAESKLLRSLEIVEVNPIVDHGGNRTGRLAVELVTSALGKLIYD